MPTKTAIRYIFAATTFWLLSEQFTEAINNNLSAQSGAQAERLEPGKQVERELAGGESNSYLISLTSGQFLRAVIGQRQMDLTAALLGPDDRPVGQFDCRWYGLEPVYFIAEKTGNYRLMIQPLHRGAARGTYQLTIEEIRAQTPIDLTLVAAVKSSTEGKQLIGEGAKSFKLAKEKYEDALPKWREIGDRFAEAQVLNSLGFLSRYLDGATKALEYFNQSLAIRQEIKDAEGEGETLNNIAAIQSALGNKEEALKNYLRALPLRRAGSDRAAEATTLGNIGLTYSALGDMQKAKEYYQQSLPIWRASGRLEGEAAALIGMGLIHAFTGDNQQSLDYFQQARVISHESKNQQAEASSYFNISKHYTELGEREKALESGLQALALFKSAFDKSGEANTLNVLGEIESTLSGDRNKALAYYDQALALFRTIKDLFSEPYSLLNLARLNADSGDTRKALDYYNQALAVLSKVKHPRGEGLTYNGLGLLYANTNQVEKALDSYNRALLLWRKMGDLRSEAATLANLARVERDSGNLAGARSHIESALTITQALRVKYKSQQLRASYSAANQRHHEFYIDLLMRMHKLQPSAGLNGVALQASESARARGLLEMLVEANADVNQGIAPALLERERSLQNQINSKAEYQYRLLREKHTPEQLEAAKQEINARIDDLQEVEEEIRKTSPRYAELKYPKPLSLQEIQQTLDSDSLLLEYSLGEEKSYLWAVTPTSIESFELPKRSEIEAHARQSYEQLEGGETGDQLRARLAQPKARAPEWATELSRILLGPVSSELGKKRLLIVADGALQYLPFAALPEPTGGRGNGETGRRGDGTTAKRIQTKTSRTNKTRPVTQSVGSPVVLSSRPVAFLPLIFNHEIVSLPSASSLSVLRREIAGREQAPKIAAVIADPVFETDDERIKKLVVEDQGDKQTAQSGDEKVFFRSAIEVGATDAQQRLQRLTFSRSEADAITTLAGADSVFRALDFDASRAMALSADLSQYRIIHFATHGLLNSQHPELSGIVLSLVDDHGRQQDGFLRLHDIYNLKLSADLVVLSACKTGLGKEIRGEGLVGLTRGFLYAGAPRVVASLWKVDDRATAELMKQFYRSMLRDGLRPAAALREAQISMWRQKRWAAPYYWAGFTLQGEWK